MKKRLLPIGYKYDFTNFIGGLICILGVFLFLIIINNTSHPIEISVWSKAAVPIISIGLILVAVDLIRNKKVRVLQKQRKVIMKKTLVPGEIVDIKRSRIDWRGRFSERQDNRNRYVYQLIVRYIDPGNGSERTAESEYYLENLFTCLSDNHADVYLYGDNGYAITDGLHVRKFGEERIVLGNKESSFHESDISFYIDIYGGVIIPIAAVLILGIIAVLIFI